MRTPCWVLIGVCAAALLFAACESGGSGAPGGQDAAGSDGVPAAVDADAGPAADGCGVDPDADAGPADGLAAPDAGGDDCPEGCVAAPAAHCEDEDTLVSYAAAGACVGGVCVYEETREGCAVRCDLLVQIGPEPARQSFFGYVQTGGGAAIPGATVRLDPYGRTATTDANGYFLLENTYRGAYTLTVRKSGYSDWQQAVAVQADTVPFQVTLGP